MKVGIMQPYLFPYIGYFHLIHAVDLFIVYDDIKYTKKGWINRNRFLRNGEPVTFTVPLKKESDYLDVKDRQVASSYDSGRLLRGLKAAYRAAPFFDVTFPLVERVLAYDRVNLFDFVYHSITEACAHLEISTPIRRSSSYEVNRSPGGLQRVLALCEHVRATTYVNAIGGKKLYDPRTFQSRGIELRFIQSEPFDYEQSGAQFVPNLSIIDVLMFNPATDVQSHVASGYRLIC